MKRLGRFFTGFVLVSVTLLLLLFLGTSAMDDRSSFTALQTEFNQKGISIAEHQYPLSGGELYYVTIGENDLPSLLLIHGSPGDWTAWKKLILTTDITQYFHLILLDRPAYQASTIAGGTLEKQSKAMAQLLQEHCHPCGVVGHSYGAALALQLSVDYPDATAAILSISGTIAAPYQSPRWYNHLANRSIISPFLPLSFRLSNKEMMALPKDLTLLETRLRRSSHHYYFLQGERDVLVDPASVFYYQNSFNQNTIHYSSRWDHFVLWTATDEVANFIKSANL
ncbi:MAG: alpha/beta fold hydrolase [Flavobacteriaceae bacterium]